MPPECRITTLEDAEEYQANLLQLGNIILMINIQELQKANEQQKVSSQKILSSTIKILALLLGAYHLIERHFQ